MLLSALFVIAYQAKILGSFPSAWAMVCFPSEFAGWPFYWLRVTTAKASLGVLLIPYTPDNSVPSRR